MPLDFIGMSMEYTSVLDWYGSPGKPNRAFEKLLRNHGTGIMRFGGNSQDTGCWRTVVKPCNYRITPPRLGVIGAGSAASGWRAQIGTNLARFDAGGGRYAGALNTVDFIKNGVLPAFSGPRRPLLLGFGIGNEPNSYAKNGFRPPSYDKPVHAADFARQVAALRRDPDPAVRGVAVSGPAYSTGSPWGTYIGAFLDPARSGGVAFATDHYYASTNVCDKRRRPPTIEQLLSREVAATADKGDPRVGRGRGLAGQDPAHGGDQQRRLPGSARGQTFLPNGRYLMMDQVNWRPDGWPTISNGTPSS